MTNKEQLDIANEEYIGLESHKNYDKIHRIQSILYSLDKNDQDLVKAMIGGWFDSQTVKE